MSLTDRHWFRSLMGGFWVYIPVAGWSRVNYNEWLDYRYQSPLRRKYVTEDHSKNDGLLWLVLAVVFALSVYAVLMP